MPSVTHPSMARKKPRRKATLHSAGKVTEADLLERARALADDPSLAIPVCEGKCVLFSPVVAARRAIPKIHAARDDEKKLASYAARGNEYAKAYAATLLVAKAEKLPYVAELRLPGGNVPYVIRGKAKPFFLAGLQNHHDRAHRLLAVAPWVRKRGIHVFSADRGLVCTGKDPTPPADFVEEEMEELDLTEKAHGVYACEHGGAGPERDALVILWKTAGVRLERCSRCTAEGSTLATLFRHMAGKRLRDGFEVAAALEPLRAAAGAHVEEPSVVSAKVLEAYLQLRASDAVFLEASRAARVGALRARKTRLFVAFPHSYGEDADAFLAALDPSPHEETALRAALAQRQEPVVIERASSARAIHELWAQHGLAMLETLTKDPEAAKRLHKEKVTVEEAADLVRRAGREGSAKAATAGLPAYRGLSGATGFTDAVARTFRASGKQAATRLALERGDVRAPGLLLALLQELGAAKGQEWRFGPGEAEAAAALAPIARTLLHEDASRYHDALAELARRLGEPSDFRSGA